jgi:hypothetical protein
MIVGNERGVAPSMRAAIFAGLFGAFDAAFLLCRAPRPPVPFASNRELFFRALTYVLAAALAGGAGSALFSRRSEERSLRSLSVIVQSSAAASVWIPSVVLLFRQDSRWMVPIAAVAAADFAASWRPFVPIDPSDASAEIDRTQLFAESLQPLPRDWRPFGFALCVYGACFEWLERDIVLASTLLAICGFAVAWQLTLTSDDATPDVKVQRRVRSRLVRTALAAFVVTFIALLAWNTSGSGTMAAGGSAADGRSRTGKDGSRKSTRDSAANFAAGLSGYQSIVLWPIGDRKKFILPPTPGIVPSLDAITKPLVIRFDGSYWYFQAPQQAPGPEAKVARGSPLAANVRSTNFMPLMMEAHEKLATLVSLACCSGLEVEIETCDDRPGDLFLGVALADSAPIGHVSSAKRELYLGLKPVTATTPGRSAAGCLPRSQTLRFAIPHSSAMRRFNEIRVIFTPDPTQAEVGARIAVKQFELVPR